MEGDVDPRSVLQAIENLSGNIADVELALTNQQGDWASQVVDLRDEEDDALSANSQIILHLQAVTLDLREITLGCIKHAKNGSSMESPLDPMLYDWISDCALILLQIKDLLATADRGSSDDATELGTETDDEWTLVEEDMTSEHADENNDAKRDEESERKETLGKLLERLKDHTAHLEDFIPIMRADLNEALATNVSRTQLPHDAPPRAPRNEGNFTAPSTQHSRNSLESLRSHLYNLSDELKTNQELLQRLSDIRTLSADIRTEVLLLKEAQAITVSTLAEVLSNNGSEWIESMLAGKLSFSEFSALDQEEISEFREGLKTRSTELRTIVRTRGRRRGVEDPVEEWADLSAAEVRWWRELVEGLNWTLKARTQL